VTFLIAGAVIAGVVAIVLALSSSGGSSHTAASKVRTRTPVRHAAAHHAAKHASGVPANAAQMSVVVVNATETNGLAHRLAAQLRGLGYAQAAPAGGRPGGFGETTVVEYAEGHHGEAQAVARSLSVATVQPLEPAVSSLAGSASVVVIAGADRAASSP
jgi:hypothetical protein